MPTIIQSAEHGSSAELQKLVLCLGVVLAFVLTSFGIGKLIELHTRTSGVSTAKKIPAGGALVISSRSYSSIGIRGFGLTAGVGASLPVVFRPKPRPRDLSTGAIRYTKTSPHLQHISAPRTYAMHHRRRLYSRPGPSPLRIVTNASKSHAKLSNKLRRHHKSTPSKDKYQRTNFIPPFPLRYVRQDTPVVVTIAPPCATPEEWLAVENLHRTADSVVSAHPDALPLHHRRELARQQRSFPWVSSSVVNVNFKFGLVRGNNAASAHRPPFGVAHQSPIGIAYRSSRLGAKIQKPAVAVSAPAKTKAAPQVLAKFGNANNVVADAKKLFRSKVPPQIHDGLRENVAAMTKKS
ncbi:hypothetical protein C8R44DRAFT_853186 [Mycena epipterygia]|nr:hypothetical protein C8R44DRAFT_853186 [Mycena epipterygia]